MNGQSINNTVKLDALRGAYVNLWNDANDLLIAAQHHRDEALRAERRAQDYKDMALAASKAFIALGGDPAVAENWYSWTYLGTNK